MKHELPKWALRPAVFEDREALLDQLNKGTLRIKYSNRKTLKNWAWERGWATPWFGFEKKFVQKMLESEFNFHSAVTGCGIEILVPKSEFTIEEKKIAILDATYQNPEERCYLIEELREIRRAVEAGVVIRIGQDRVIKSWQQFYGWAHERYHILEDGCDKWIGDDS